METLKLLGGKYNSAEQILPGVIQTYRAIETATGRSVFVHRFPSGDDAGQQLMLYRLLAAALVRSPAVRSMVLDMRDENNDWFVVTDTAPQCLLLREWLQFELGSSAKLSEGKKEVIAQPAVSTSALSPSSSSTIPATLPPAARPEEPGEFTRLFAPNMPASSPKSSPVLDRLSSPDLHKEDRPGRSGSVQRPHTPMPFVPPVTPHGTEPGEFTRLFSKVGTGEPGQNSRPPLDRPKASTDYQDLFESPSEPMAPTAPATQQPGEYTRIFGKGNAPPPVQERSAFGEGASRNYDDPLMTSPEETEKGPRGQATAEPSEYTRVLAGSGASVSAAVKSPRPPSSSAAVVGSSAENSMGSVQGNATHLSMVDPKLQPSLTAGNQSAVGISAKNTKMIVFFAVLGIMALLLILSVVLALRK